MEIGSKTKQMIAQMISLLVSDRSPKKSNAPKGETMTNENPILEEGVILNEMGIEEVEEVLAPAIYLTA